jgi:hypothetical protein
MLATVIMGTGPQETQIDLIPGNLDGLAVIRKWKDDFWAFSIVAPVPGYNVWMIVGGRNDYDSPSFPHGKVRASIENLISRLPALCARFASDASFPWSPTELALAKHLGYLSPEQIARHQILVAAEKHQRDEIAASREAEKQQAHARELDKAFTAFKAGDMISVDHFEELLKLANIDLHPRTLGSLRAKVSKIGHRNAMMHGKGKLPDGVWHAASQLALTRG